ncbi:MAG TPA: hypothetical protein DCE44_16850, partial [Verrucomicrobiales bacterium]|nr:hypothetical protein [Verrucomicrobiales bacterium]
MKKPFLQQPHRLGSRVVARPGQADVSADSSLKPKSTRGSTPLAAAVVALASLSLLAPANAADKTYDFTTDPSADLTIAGNGVNDAPWVSSGGNPGGFLAITYPQDGMSTTVVFPNLDPGKIVTGFTFTCDLRVGNSEGDRPADGFSISFARDGDPILTDPNSDAGFAGNCCPETGTKTGIAVSFDTWSGNVFPNDPSDTTDIEGIIVRVDDRTVQKVSLPTRHGTADDITSLQTGPRDAQFWTDSTDHIADSRTPASWDTLQWRPFGITMTEDGKLTVIWKGNKVLDNFQTTYFPTAGQLVFAGRTGGESEHTHVDNIHLTTTAAAVTAVPGAPPNFQASVGARRVGLSWGAAVVEGDPNARVAYEIERDGVVIVPITTALSYEDRFVEPNKTYTYKVRGKNIAGNPGPDSTKSATTTGEVAGTFFLPAEQWLNLQGTWDTAVQEIVGVPPAITRYVNGFSFGETSNFGNTWGENHLVKISGVFTAPESGNFRFFLRSDDSSALFVKAGTTPPDPSLEFPIATETQCCGAFAEPNPAAPPEETSEPIALTAGAKYGITLVVKEGGGGDWGQVATRKEGELIPTKASTLTPLRGAVLAGLVDTLGATVSITTNPADATVNANSSVSFTAAATGSSPYGGDYGNVVAYQWYNGGVPVLNANGPTYTIQYPSKALSGNKIKVVAAVAGATATSTEATLTVNDDVTPPTVTRISGSATFDSMTVVYSEPVSDSALTVGNYNIPGLTLSSPTRLDALSVRFATTKQTEDTSYPVTINGVQDLAGLPSAYTGTFYSFVFKPGQVVYKTWQGQTGPFTDFTDAVPPVGSLPPSSISLRNEFVSNDGDEYENYFGQVSGFFIPATSGNYVFFLSSDDHGELYLSTDADPANKKKIAEEPSWSARRYWVGNGVDNNSATRGEPGSLSNRSDQYPSTEWTTGVGGDISLTAGNRYYVEVLYKEGGGGDHGGVTVIKKGDPDPANTTSTLLGNLIGTYVDPTTFPPIITTRPSTVKYSKGETVSFSVQAESKLPLTYKWYHNKHLIPGAT